LVDMAPLSGETARTLYPPRRLGEVLLTQETLHTLLGVPEGLRIVGIRMDEARRTLVVTVEGGELPLVWEGSSLPLVREGMEAPIVAGQWEYTHVEMPPASDEDVTGEGQASEVLSYGRLDWWPHG
jgi:hypothetical protein